MTDKAGRGLDNRVDIDASEGVQRGAGRGISTGAGLEDISLSPTVTYVSFFDEVRRPFTGRSFVVRGSDVALGLIYLSLYRLARVELLATSWTIRKAFTVSVALPALTGTVSVNFPSPRNIDADSFWAVGVRSANTPVSVYGTEDGTPPGFDNFSVASADPDTILSASATRTRLTPSVQLLSLSGLRLRSS